VKVDLRKHNLKLTYPCTWDYKLIGASESRLRRAVAQVMGPVRHSVSLSNTSRTGKYCSLKVELTVRNQQQQMQLFQAFKAHEDVILVL